VSSWLLRVCSTHCERGAVAVAYGGARLLAVHGVLIWEEGRK